MSVNQVDADDISALEGIVSVSRETRMHLERYVALLEKWQASDNLVASSTLPLVWRRHIADSAQLTHYFPQARNWLDLGSGAGFPGLVIAILIGQSSGSCVHLVESNQRKCSFLRNVIRETGAPAIVHQGRIEAAVAEWSEPVDMICARALAPLDRLFSMAEPVFSSGAQGAFHRGQDFEREIEESTKSWSFDLIRHQSLTDRNSAILEIHNLTRKARDANGIRDRK